MVARGVAWHAILSAAPTWRRARRADALQGTFIGVLMSATLPARLGEPSRALIVARRLGRARETLPVVLGTMVSQTLLNLLALAILGAVMLSSVDFLHGHDRALLAVALAPLAALVALLLAPVLVPPRGGLALGAAAVAALAGARARCCACATACASSATAPGGRSPRRSARRVGAAVALLLAAADGARARGRVGLRRRRGGAVRRQRDRGAPATPANVGVFQAACVAVLAGAYHVSTADALAYGIVLQAVEVATA